MYSDIRAIYHTGTYFAHYKYSEHYCILKFQSVINILNILTS